MMVLSSSWCHETICMHIDKVALLSNELIVSIDKEKTGEEKRRVIRSAHHTHTCLAESRRLQVVIVRIGGEKKDFLHIDMSKFETSSIISTSNDEVYLADREILFDRTYSSHCLFHRFVLLIVRLKPRRKKETIHHGKPKKRTKKARDPIGLS